MCIGIVDFCFRVMGKTSCFWICDCMSLLLSFAFWSFYSSAFFGCIKMSCYITLNNLTYLTPLKPFAFYIFACNSYFYFNPSFCVERIKISRTKRKKKNLQIWYSFLFLEITLSPTKLQLFYIVPFYFIQQIGVLLEKLGRA